ncbi:MAG: hypothetical protein GY953_14375 [bacterium]|nr:hypothetical protein [bacterium]
MLISDDFNVEGSGSGWKAYDTWDGAVGSGVASVTNSSKFRAFAIPIDTTIVDALYISYDFRHDGGDSGGGISFFSGNSEVLFIGRLPGQFLDGSRYGISASGHDNWELKPFVETPTDRIVVKVDFDKFSDGNDLITFYLNDVDVGPDPDALIIVSRTGRPDTWTQLRIETTGTIAVDNLVITGNPADIPEIVTPPPLLPLPPPPPPMPVLIQDDFSASGSGTGWAADDTWDGAVASGAASVSGTVRFRAFAMPINTTTIDKLYISFDLRHDGDNWGGVLFYNGDSEELLIGHPDGASQYGFDVTGGFGLGVGGPGIDMETHRITGEIDFEGAPNGKDLMRLFVDHLDFNAPDATLEVEGFAVPYYLTQLGIATNGTVVVDNLMITDNPADISPPTPPPSALVAPIRDDFSAPGSGTGWADGDSWDGTVASGVAEAINPLREFASPITTTGTLYVSFDFRRDGGSWGGVSFFDGDTEALFIGHPRGSSRYGVDVPGFGAIVGATALDSAFHRITVKIIFGGGAGGSDVINLFVDQLDNFVGATVTTGALPGYLTHLRIVTDGYVAVDNLVITDDPADIPSP